MENHQARCRWPWRDSANIWPPRRALVTACPSWLPAPAWPTSWL